MFYQDYYQLTTGVFGLMGVVGFGLRVLRFRFGVFKVRGFEGLRL